MNSKNNALSIILIIITICLAPISIITFIALYMKLAGAGGWLIFFTLPALILYVILGIPSYIMAIIAVFSDFKEKEWMVSGEVIRCMPLFILGFLGSGMGDQPEIFFLGRVVSTSEPSSMLSLAETAHQIFVILGVALIAISAIVLIVDIVLTIKIARKKKMLRARQANMPVDA